MLNILLQILLLVFGFVLLVKGADFFVEGVSDIAAHFGIPQMIIGLTIVAFGTSAPEAAVSITAAINKAGGVAVGNIVGSNIMNIWLILGISAVVSPMIVKKNTARIEIPFTILVSGIFMVLGLFNNQLSYISGIILWIFMIIFLAYLFISAKKEMKENKQKEIENNVPREKEHQFKLIPTLITSVLGGAAVIVGANLAVNSATTIATICNISQDIIGLTIVAFGTSLPELVTSVTASKKGKNDIAIGNIVGSNIFNILFVIGTAAIISPVEFSSEFILDSIVMVAAAVTLFAFTIKRKKLSRLGGILMLLMYAVYFGYLIYEVVG